MANERYNMARTFHASHDFLQFLVLCLLVGIKNLWFLIG
jgi:hypothetical protein